MEYWNLYGLGSGKTLAYALPVLCNILDRIIVRLRVLIVLPTKELTLQVKSVFDSLVAGTDIKVVCLTGQTTFILEQSKLCKKGVGAVDVLITTPGKLLDHLEGTPGFTLEHLEYLVLDEADRLMNQSYQNWLEKILDI